MRKVAFAVLTAVFSQALSVFAEAPSHCLFIDAKLYKIGESGAWQELSTLPDLSIVSPEGGEGYVLSNAMTSAQNKNVYTVKVPFGYKVGKWMKAYDDPFVFTDGEAIAGSEGALTVTIPWDNRCRNWIHLGVVLEYDNDRTFTLGKSPFGAGTVGTNLGEHACQKGDVFNLTASPAHDDKTGFDRAVFRRWSDGVTDSRRRVVIDTNMTLIAEFVPKSWEVTFDADGGNVSPTSKWVTCDATYGWMPTPVKLGNAFAGWYSQPQAGELVEFDTTVGALGDHSLYARWTPASYTIDYALCGEGNGYVDGIGTYPFGTPAKLTANAYEGSVFAGWEDGETRNPRVVTVESNAVYGAMFDIRTYEVSFTYRNAQGEVTVTPVQTVRHGEAAVPPDVSAYDSWPEHHFRTWSTEEYKEVKRGLAGEQSVQAIYDDMTYAVVFVYCDRDGNAVTTMPQHVVSGGAAKPPSDSVANNWVDHELVGWQPDYGVIRTNLVVEAVYTAYYTVDYVLSEEGDGNGKVDGIGRHLSGTTVELTAKPYEGSVFVGWDDGETLNPRRVTVTSNAVYGVRFDTATYDVTFTYRAADGSEVVSDVQKVKHGEAAVPPDASAYDSWPYHSFKTWSTEDYKKVTHDLTGDRSVRAVYDDMTFAVTFVYHGRDGNAVTAMPQHVVAGASATPPPDSVADNWAGHKRVDWQPDYSVVLSNLTVEAVYEEYGTVGFVVSGEGNGTVEGAGEYPLGKQVTLTARPDVGSVFVGWDDGETLNPRRVIVTSNAVYGARFDAATYGVTFTYRDADGREVVSDMQTVKHGAAAVPPEASAYDSWPYHAFKTWSTEDYKKVTQDLTGDRSVRAIYDDETFAVTFVYCGRDGNAVTTMPQHVVAGKAAVPPADANNWTGHTLVGWRPDFSVVRSDLTVEAEYELNVYDVDFIYFNVEGKETTQRHEVEFEGLVPFDSVSSLTNEWPNHAFRYWSIGGKEVVGDVVVSNDLRVVAIYEGAKYYSVSFVYRDEVGNWVTNEPQQVMAGTSAVPPPDSVANKWNGHTLTGWQPDFSVIRSDLIVEAIYDADVNVDYVVSGEGDGIVEGVGQYAVGSSVTLLATAREGSEFAGWADGETHNPRRVTVTSNVTYGVKFDLKTYDVTFIYYNDKGGKVTENKKAKHGKEAELPNESDYNNWPYHTFSGWSSTDYKAVTRNLTGNESIEAKYDEYALVIYDANGGEGGQIVETNYTGVVKLMTPPFTKTGYVCQEWWTNEAKTVSVEVDEKIDVAKGRDNNFFARWKPIEYTLRFDGNGGTYTKTLVEKQLKRPEGVTIEYDEAEVYFEIKNLKYDEEVTFVWWPNMYKKDGFTIDGWDKNGETYQWNIDNKELKVKNLTTIQGSMVEFDAIWRAIEQ